MARRQACVVLVRRILLGVQAAHEDDARNLLGEEQIHVVRLGDPAGGLGAQDRREAPLGQPGADGFGEGGKYRVLKLRQNQAHESSAFAPKLGRALVAQDVERRQHGLARGFTYARLLIEDAADRGLADADFPGYFRKSLCHTRNSTQKLDRRCKRFAGLDDNGDFDALRRLPA